MRDVPEKYKIMCKNFEKTDFGKFMRFSQKKSGFLQLGLYAYVGENIVGNSFLLQYLAFVSFFPLCHNFSREN